MPLMEKDSPVLAYLGIARRRRLGAGVPDPVPPDPTSG